MSGISTLPSVLLGLGWWALGIWVALQPVRRAEKRLMSTIFIVMRLWRIFIVHRRAGPESLISCLAMAVVNTATYFVGHVSAAAGRRLSASLVSLLSTYDSARHSQDPSPLSTPSPSEVIPQPFRPSAREDMLSLSPEAAPSNLSLTRPGRGRPRRHWPLEGLLLLLPLRLLLLLQVPPRATQLAQLLHGLGAREAAGALALAHGHATWLGLGLGLELELELG